MGVKVYISGMSGNKEVKKRQQRVLMILDSKNIKYEVVDIAEPGNEDAKEFMQNNAKSLGATIGDANPRSPLPPQIFNDKDYCGDYDAFDMSNEVDEIEKFLKLSHEKIDKVETSLAAIKLENGESKPDEVPKDDKVETNEVPEKDEAKKEEEPTKEDNTQNSDEPVEGTKETTEEVAQDDNKEEESKEADEKVDNAKENSEENEKKEENEVDKPETRNA